MFLYGSWSSSSSQATRMLREAWRKWSVMFGLGVELDILREGKGKAFEKAVRLRNGLEGQGLDLE